MGRQGQAAGERKKGECIMGKVRITSIILTVIIAGCASYSQMFVNSEGRIMRCSHTGGGGIGVVMATQAQRNCMSDLKDLGYIEYEKAGGIGVVLKDQQFENREAIVLKVLPGLPADKAGIMVNDKIISVNNTQCNTIKECRIAMFGEAGRPTEISVLRNGEKINFKIILEQAPVIAEAIKNK